MSTMTINPAALPDARGHFGTFGGAFVPETLMTAFQERTTAYELAKRRSCVSGGVGGAAQGLLRPADATLLRGAMRPKPWVEPRFT